MKPYGSRYLLSAAVVLASAAASADAHDAATDVPRVENAGNAKALGVTSVECDTPSGSPRVAHCTFVSVTVSEKANHVCTLSTQINQLQMTQIDANTWKNEWPPSGACKQASSTVLVRSKKKSNKWIVKDITTIPKVAAGAAAEVHTECDAKVGTKAEVSDADAHRVRKVDCESFDL